MVALAGGGFLLPQDTLSRMGVRRTANSPAKEWFLNRALRVDDDWQKRSTREVGECHIHQIADYPSQEQLQRSYS